MTRLGIASFLHIIPQPLTCVHGAISTIRHGTLLERSTATSCMAQPLLSVPHKGLDLIHKSFSSVQQMDSVVGIGNDAPRSVSASPQIAKQFRLNPKRSVWILITGHHQRRHMDPGRVAVVELIQMIPLGLDGVAHHCRFGEQSRRFRRDRTLHGKVFDGAVVFVLHVRFVSSVGILHVQRHARISHERIVNRTVQYQLGH
mmetsp:Transcript_33/g.98  ORF Transcript_33/g.98 Transcript_33/m.98 type:complete len:201 (+) Transcript_33:153-755(+)